MAKKHDEKIDPVEFLTMYQKIQALNPRTLERICGIMEGIGIGVEIATEEIKETKTA